MHRLSSFSSRFATGLPALCLVALVACGGGKKPAEDASDKTTAEADAKEGKNGDSADKGEGSGDKENGDKEGAPKKDDCAGFDIASLDDALLKSACEVPNAKPDTVPNVELKGKVEVSVVSSPTKLAPGGKADLLVSFVNKTKDPITLSFRIDPTARFDVEVYDKKNKRVDMPAGQPPSPPKGHTPPPPAEPKVAKVTIAPNGSARQRVPWEAVKMAWAPDKVRGWPVERGFPRKAAGPLPKGKYTVKVVTPLVGVMEGGEHEISAPKVEIEIGG